MTNIKESVLTEEQLKEQRKAEIKAAQQARRREAKAIDRKQYSHGQKFVGIKDRLVELSGAKSNTQFLKGNFSVNGALLDLVPNGAIIDKQKLASCMNTKDMLRLLTPSQIHAVTFGKWSDKDVSTYALLGRIMQIACMDNEQYDRAYQRGETTLLKYEQMKKAIASGEALGTL